MRTTIALSGYILLAFAATADAGTVTFFDGTFNNPPGWTGSQVASTGFTTPPSFLFTTITSGVPSAGDPGNWEQDTHSFDSQGAAGVRFLNIDPVNSFTGSFDSLTYSYNLQDAGSLGVAYSIALKFNGILYTGPLDGDTPNGSTWSSFGATNLLAPSFCQVNSNLSIGGCLSSFTSGTYEFGYLVANSDLTGGPRNYTSGIDNWSVSLNNAAPEPSSFTLFCGGGLLVVFWGLKKRARKSPAVGISA